MIQWFEQPYQVRDTGGLDVLLQGVYLDHEGHMHAIIIEQDGTYTYASLMGLTTEWRYDLKHRTWAGGDDDDG